MAMITLDTEQPVWSHFFTVAPLVVIGTREENGYNLAPKHMAMPMGWRNYFGFVCTPHHRTYHNAKHSGAFTVSFPRPTQVVLASLAASARCDAPGTKPGLAALPTAPAEVVDGVCLEDAYICLECELDRVVDGLGENSLLIGRVVGARVDEEALRVSEGDDQQLVHRAPLIVYLQPERYAVVDESFAFPFPVNFQR